MSDGPRKHWQGFDGTSITSDGRYRPPKPLNFSRFPHAIIDTSGIVIAIRDYPRATNSSAVVKIAEGAKCKVGWKHTGNGHFKDPSDV